MNDMPLQAAATLAWWHPAAWLGTWRDADPVLGLAALALLAVVAAAALHHWWRVPRALGTMLVGTLASPALLGVLQQTDLDPFKPLLDLAVAALLFELGSRLRPRWLLDNPGLAAMCVLEGALAGAAVAGALVWLGAPTASALIAGAVAASTSPVITLVMVHEQQPRGQVAERLLTMAAFNSVLAMLAVKLWPLLAALHSDGIGESALPLAANALVVLCGSFLLGAACAAVLNVASRAARDNASMPVLQLALVVMAAMLALAWGLSPLLALLVAGMVARARMGHRLQVQPQLGSAGAVLTVLLLISLGLFSTLDGLLALWPWVAAIIGARLLGKALAVALLARPSGLGWRQAAALTLALQPMSSLAVLLVAPSFGWPAQLPGLDPQVLQALLVATTLMQLSGPLWVQAGLCGVAAECPASMERQTRRRLWGRPGAAPSASSTQPLATQAEVKHAA